MAKHEYFNIVITGCRKPNGQKMTKAQRKLVRAYIKKFSNIKSNVRFLIGCANGVDKVARRYCKRKGIPYKKFKADWSQGSSAGHCRNAEMVLIARMGLAFWDGHSGGTKDCIDRVKQKKRPIHIARLDMV